MTEDMPGRAEAGCYVFACRDGRGFLVVSADDAVCVRCWDIRPLHVLTVLLCRLPCVTGLKRMHAKLKRPHQKDGHTSHLPFSRRVRPAIEPLVSTMESGYPI